VLGLQRNEGGLKNITESRLLRYAGLRLLLGGAERPNRR